MFPEPIVPRAKAPPDKHTKRSEKGYGDKNVSCPVVSCSRCVVLCRRLPCALCRVVPCRVVSCPAACRAP